MPYLNWMFSKEHRDNLANGCPMTASATEIGRHNTELANEFKRAFQETAKILEASIAAKIPASRKRRLAVLALLTEFGAVAVARGVAKVDATLSEEVLRAAREAMETMQSAEVEKAKTSRRPKGKVRTRRLRYRARLGECPASPSQRAPSTC
jgi:TetR/AcrR family transcriptional regulator, transcriptional repressor for nem operon